MFSGAAHVSRVRSHREEQAVEYLKQGRGEGTSARKESEFDKMERKKHRYSGERREGMIT
jgi:hypothetical protein